MASERQDSTSKTGLFKTTHTEIKNAGLADFVEVFGNQIPWQEKAAKLAQWVLDEKPFSESFARRDEAQHEARDLLDHLEALESATRPGIVADLAYTIGALHQTLSVRFGERYAEMGRKSLDGAKRGHVATHGTAEEKAARYAAYQQFIDATLAENSFMKYGLACQLAAERFECCDKTIQRHTQKKRK